MGLILTPNTEVSPALRITAPDVLVMHGRLRVGRIHKRESAFNPAFQCVWEITGVFDGPDGMHRSGMTATIEEAQASLKENWERWLSWANLSEAGTTVEAQAAHKRSE